jgi:hypothetical protein
LKVGGRRFYYQDTLDGFIRGESRKSTTCVA